MSLLSRAPRSGRLTPEGLDALLPSGDPTFDELAGKLQQPGVILALDDHSTALVAASVNLGMLHLDAEATAQLRQRFVSDVRPQLDSEVRRRREMQADVALFSNSVPDGNAHDLVWLYTLSETPHRLSESQRHEIAQALPSVLAFSLSRFIKRTREVTKAVAFLSKPKALAIMASAVLLTSASVFKLSEFATLLTEHGELLAALPALVESAVAAGAAVWGVVKTVRDARSFEDSEVATMRTCGIRDMGVLEESTPAAMMEPTVRQLRVRVTAAARNRAVAPGTALPPPAHARTL